MKDVITAADLDAAEEATRPLLPELDVLIGSVETRLLDVHEICRVFSVPPADVHREIEDIVTNGPFSPKGAVELREECRRRFDTSARRRWWQFWKRG